MDITKKWWSLLG